MSEQRGGSDQERIIVAGGIIAAAYFLVIKPTFAAFGNDPAATDVVNKTVSAADADNPFSPNWLFSHPELGSPSNSVSFWQNFQNNYNSDPVLADNPPGVYLAEQLLAGIGHFSNDLNVVNAAFNSITTKYDVGNAAVYLNELYQIDLMSLLRNGRGWFFSKGIGDTAIAQIVNRVNSLPGK